MSIELSRRLVVGGAVAAASLAGSAHAQTRRPYRVGVIGAGWFGKLDLNALMNVAPVEVVALCDVDRNMLEQARTLTRNRRDTVTRQRRNAAIYADYRRMLAAHEFDIVIVATPDHWHALPAIEAMSRGAHVYLEKPICVDLAEGKALVAAARQHNRIVQVGTQRRIHPYLLDARRRVMDSGLMGKVGHVETYCYFDQRPPHFPEPTAPPENLDWNAYCGPAPLIPFRTPMHPRDWRAFMEFGNGYIGDVGVHMIDCVRAMLDLQWPKSVTSEGGVFVHTESASNVPDTQSATFQFDNLIMTWTNRPWGRPGAPEEAWGAAIHGENGTLNIYGNRYEYVPKAGDERFGMSIDDETAQFPQDLEIQDWERPLAAMTRANMRDFVRAIETNGQTASNIVEGHISTGYCILANMAFKLQRKLHWDASAERLIGDDEANGLLARPYRAPWVHP